MKILNVLKKLIKALRRKNRNKLKVINASDQERIMQRHYQSGKFGKIDGDL